MTTPTSFCAGQLCRRRRSENVGHGDRCQVSFDRLKLPHPALPIECSEASVWRGINGVIADSTERAQRLALGHWLDLGGCSEAALAATLSPTSGASRERVEAGEAEGYSAAETCGTGWVKEPAGVGIA
jgi:hypothetical protein